MAEGGGDTFLAAVVEGYDAAVAQRQLYLALALLARYLSRHGAVYLVGEPVLAGYGLQLQHTLQVFFYLILCVGHVLIVALHGVVAHDGLRRVTEHLGNVQVEGLHTVALLEREVGVTGGLADDVQRGTLALGNLADMVNMFLVDEQTHALLTLVGNDLLAGEGLIADGQFRHVNLAATLLDQLGQTVQVSGRAVVVDADDGVHVFLAEGAHQVVGTLLHLGVGTLDGVQLDTVGIAAGVYRRHRTAAEADAVVIATDDHHFISLLWLFLQAVALRAVAHASRQHDHLVVGILRGSPPYCPRGGLITFQDICVPLGGRQGGFLVLKRQHRPANQRLSELIPEVRGAVRSLDQYLLRRLVQPLTYRQDVLPVAGSPLIVCQTRVGRHIHRCAGYRPGADATAHTVADLTARSRGGTVERLHRRGEVVRLGLQRDDALYILHLEPVARALVFRCKLLHHGTLGEGHVVLIG